MELPNLKRTNRDREFNNYSEELRDTVVYEYLFKGKSHRQLDEDVLRIDGASSSGWQSMNILHHLGLERVYKGLFRKSTPVEAMDIILQHIDSYFDDNWNLIYNCLSRYFSNNDNTSLKSYSWEIVSEDTAFKQLDKSAFEHRGTGIPVEVRNFFRIDNLAVGDSRQIRLFYDSEHYSAKIALGKNLRTRLLWENDFSLLLQDRFSEFYSEITSGNEISGEAPRIRFKRLLVNSNITVEFDDYLVSLIQPISIDVLKTDVEAEKIENEDFRKEGAVSLYYGKRYERNPVNRKRAIDIHGVSCIVCGFNFEKVYGERGRDFIEVHHIKPLHTFAGEQQEINPESDLVPVCANCHRMIHRRHDDVLTIEQLRNVLLK